MRISQQKKTASIPRTIQSYLKDFMLNQSTEALLNVFVVGGGEVLPVTKNLELPDVGRSVAVVKPGTQVTLAACATQGVVLTQVCVVAGR